jgi:cytochrome o ubiquinol oxidase subunit IV
MTATQYDRAPGDRSRPADLQRGAPQGVLLYTIGLALAVVLTATSFWAANTSLLWPPGVPLGLAALAITQMGVHLVFFLHITSGPDNTNNVLALAFGVLIVFLVITGSLWIMTNLNENMMPSSELMSLHPTTTNHHQREKRSLQMSDLRVRPVAGRYGRRGYRGRTMSALPRAGTHRPAYPE